MASFEAPVLLTFELRVGETLACDVLAEGDVFIGSISFISTRGSRKSSDIGTDLAPRP